MSWANASIRQPNPDKKNYNSSYYCRNVAQDKQEFSRLLQKFVGRFYPLKLSFPKLYVAPTQATNRVFLLFSSFL